MAWASETDIASPQGVVSGRRTPRERISALNAVRKASASAALGTVRCYNYFVRSYNYLRVYAPSYPTADAHLASMRNVPLPRTSSTTTVAGSRLPVPARSVTDAVQPS